MTSPCLGGSWSPVKDASGGGDVATPNAAGGRENGARRLPGEPAGGMQVGLGLGGGGVRWNPGEDRGGTGTSASLTRLLVTRLGSISEGRTGRVWVGRMSEEGEMDPGGGGCKVSTFAFGGDIWGSRSGSSWDLGRLGGASGFGGVLERHLELGRAPGGCLDRNLALTALRAIMKAADGASISRSKR